MKSAVMKTVLGEVRLLTTTVEKIDVTDTDIVTVDCPDKCVYPRRSRSFVGHRGRTIRTTESQSVEQKTNELIVSYGGHVNVATYLGTATTYRPDDTLVFERIPGDDLYNLIKMREATAFEEREITDMLFDVGSALHFLHNTVGVLHGDVSPENIVYNNDQDRYVVIDMGQTVDITRARQCRRSPRPTKICYAAPEQIFHDRGSHVDHITAIDVFALGMSGIVIAVGAHLYNASNAIHILRHLSRPMIANFIKEYRPAVFPILSDIMIDLLCDMVDVDPRKRPTASEVVDRCVWML
jgi:serine/threonine protein kinase